MADTTVAAAAAESKRVEQPDEAKYKASLAEAEKEHDAAKKAFQAAKSKWEGARGGSTNTPNDRFSQLVAEQKDIRAKQQENKVSKGAQHDKYSKNETEIKKLFEEQKELRARSGFKNVEELESKVKSLNAQVEKGNLKVVDEKKILEEVRGLNRQKKTFGEQDTLTKRIDQLKAENVELKKTFDNPEIKALSAKYDTNQKELDQIKSERQNSKDNRESIKADKDKAYEQQQSAYEKLKKVKDDYYAQRREYKAHQDKIYQQKRDRQKAERDAYEKEKRAKIAAEELDEASTPAFSDEIRTAVTLIKHFDPSYSTTQEDKDAGKYAASAQRTIDEAGFKDMKPFKKEEEDFFVGGGGKKKKGKKAPAAADSGKFSIGIDLLENCSKIGVDPPSSQADVAPFVEKVKAKVDAWKKDSDAQTKKNIAEAQAKVDKIEQDAAAASASAPVENGRRDRGKKLAQDSADPSAEAQQEQEKNAADDVAKELEAAKLEDSQTPDVVSA